MSTSAAMLFAVNGWSPVIMTGLIPMRLIDWIFSLMPGFKTSFSRIIPMASSFRARAIGVSPSVEIFSATLA